MTIPTEATLDALATHGLVARHCILHKPCEQVTVVRQPISERWTIIKDVLVFAVRTSFMLRNRRFKGFIVCPICECLAFKRRKLRLRLYRWIRHGASVYGLGTLGAGISSRE